VKRGWGSWLSYHCQSPCFGYPLPTPLISYLIGVLGSRFMVVPQVFGDFILETDGQEEDRRGPEDGHNNSYHQVHASVPRKVRSR
jgi:hypothetical protein